MRILVTGASGFIGSHLVEEGLKQGFEVWAGVRSSSKREYLQDSRIHFAELDLSDPIRLKEQLLSCRNAMNGLCWDYVVHAAGATKCQHREDFFRANTDGTRHLIDGLRLTNMIPQRFVFLSSLSVFGAIRENPVRKATAENPWIYSPILLSDIPHPNTAYGQSKLQAEEYLQSLSDFPYTILRPTGVYGPREKDYFLMAQSILKHVDFSVGFRPQEITFVYVDDIVHAVYQCLHHIETKGKAYFLSDGNVYHSSDFSLLLQKHLGNPRLLCIKAPLWLLCVVCRMSSLLSRLTGRVNALNNDKYQILRQRNWQCDIEPARQDFGYEPKWTLEQGVPAVVQWYKQMHWL